MDIKFATMIGSMPHKAPERAVELVFKYLPACPCWPQLPKRHVRENMYFQYAENFPGIRMDEAREKSWVDEEKFNLGIREGLTPNRFSGAVGVFFAGTHTFLIVPVGKSGDLFRLR